MVAQDIYSVHYDSTNHYSVIFQKHGSIWNKVLPYCLINVAITIIIHILKFHFNVDLSITDKGHNITGLFVAFLIVSRVTMSIERYNKARTNIGAMYRETRELIQMAFVFTKDDQSQGAKECRNELAYHTLLLLRVSMAVIDYPTTNLPVWEIPELRSPEKEYVLNNLQNSVNGRRWAHAERGIREENMRVPVRLAFLLRQTIFDSKKRLKEELASWQLGRLFSAVDSCMVGYYGMGKFMTTPFPFPLVQMARTFLFVYVFTLPFALMDDRSNFFVHCCVAFLVTYGFVGLEIVSIEMDDPFGDDENDFDNLAMAKTAFEDTYLNVNDVDGPEWADKLRNKMRVEDDDCDRPMERSGLLDYNSV